MRTNDWIMKSVGCLSERAMFLDGKVLRKQSKNILIKDYENNVFEIIIDQEVLLCMNHLCHKWCHRFRTPGSRIAVDYNFNRMFWFAGFECG